MSRLPPCQSPWAPRRCRMKFDPMKPAPPATRSRTPFSFIPRSFPDASMPRILRSSPRNFPLRSEGGSSVLPLPGVGDVVVVRVDPVLVRLVVPVGLRGDVDQQRLLEADRFGPVEDQRRGPQQDRTVLSPEELVHLPPRRRPL